MSQFDSNRDGKLSFGELAKALNSEFGASSFASVKKTDPVEEKLQQLADWIMANYDVNKDQTLDDSEAQKLWSDIQSYDYAGVVVGDVAQAKAWIAKFDTNKDGKITVGELYNALKSETGAVSFSTLPSKKVDEFDQQVIQLADWIMANYDTNKDQTLDDVEAQKLWNDVQSYDYAGVVAADVAQVKSWIASFDANKDGKITLKELCNAIKAEAGPISLATTMPAKRVQRVDQFDQQVQQVADWIMTNYDTNKDQTLDDSEAQKLWSDVQSYDYAGIVVGDVAQAKAWIAKFDTNKDGKITVGELCNAIKAEGPISLAAQPVRAVNATNTTSPAKNTTHVHQESAEDKKLKQYAKWVLDNYDTNKDGQLDESEAQKLWNDIASYDYSGEIIAQVGQIQAWISKFDTNKNGKLTIGELYIALSQFA